MHVLEKKIVILREAEDLLFARAKGPRSNQENA